MHRLAATVLLDLRLQLRNGFYYAVAFVLACWFLLLTRLPPLDWGYVLPAVVFGNLVMVNFYFVAGLVLLEKGEGTLEAQVVTPLADWEYLALPMPHNFSLDFMKPLRYRGEHGDSESGRAQPAGQPHPTASGAGRVGIAGHSRPRAGCRSRL